MHESSRITLLAWPFGVLAVAVVSMWSFTGNHCLAGEVKPKAQPKPDARALKDPCPDPYAGKPPDFLNHIARGSGYRGPFQGWPQPAKLMKLSQEKSFFTLNLVNEDSRAYALVAEGIKKEREGQYRDAMKVYQVLFEKMLNRDPDILYRTSPYGIFVPVSQYVQRRILNFPKEELKFYRTMHDAKAKEAFEQARRQYSLGGLSEIVDKMLATSYGDNALLELGNAALDTGHFLEALEYFTSIRDFFPDSEFQNEVLRLRIAYCRKMLGQKAEAKPASGSGTAKLDPKALASLRRVAASAKYVKPPFHSQRASFPHVATDDYTLHPPTTDPLALKQSVWKKALPGARNDYHVFSQPVVTLNNVIYRHKNILYCRSILNGELRWTNDLGGRAVWQNRGGRQYPQEDCLVQDGLVFSVMYKGGPSLVAMDEVTGQLKWAYGPMVASNAEESRMRFEAGPSGGPRTIYAGYILDNIEGETHTDTEYGVMAFDSATGRVRWRKKLCRLTPGKFAGGFATRHRNRIRSFASPPLYHQGTVYYSTNAGVVAAMDARSGRIKWLMRYPYAVAPSNIHDATRGFGRNEDSRYLAGTFSPMLWYNQRPLMIGERLYVLPVDTKFLLCLDRRSGKALWSRVRGVHYKDRQKHWRHANGGIAHMLGPTRSGHLVLVYQGRSQPVQMVDPANGKTVWTSPDLWMRDSQPSSSYMNGAPPIPGARPLLTENDTLYVPQFTYFRSWHSKRGWSYHYGSHLAEVDLKERKILKQRRYYGPGVLAYAEWWITVQGPRDLKDLEPIPHKDKKVKAQIAWLKRIIADKTPENRYGPFEPYARLTFRRHGNTFELRMGPRGISMLYDLGEVAKVLEKRRDPEAEFALAELALADSRLDDASARLKKCLKTVSSEDLDFRAAINQLLFRVYRRLARGSIRVGNVERELENVLGMSRTAGTLAEEIETLLALSEAYAAKGNLPAASRCLRSVIGTYGHYEYPVAALASWKRAKVRNEVDGILDRAMKLVDKKLYHREFTRPLQLLRKGFGLYHRTVSPLPKTLSLRAGELAAVKLRTLQKQWPEFATRFEASARKVLVGRTADERLHTLWQFPGTKTGQETLDALFKETDQLELRAQRQRLWQLADAARVCGLTVPTAYKSRVCAPSDRKESEALAEPFTPRTHEFDGTDSPSRLVLERRGSRSCHPQLLFIGARVRKRLDNKFMLTCMDLKAGKQIWESKNIRLRGLGQEPGFWQAFVHGDVVVTHGLYDVLAFDIKDGSERWRFRVPFNFEIKHAVMSGDLLVLSGEVETIALYMQSDAKNGEVAWQVTEQGDLYDAPYFQGERLIGVRKMPFNVTVRYRATGKLIGRLELPDLSVHRAHPLLKGGPLSLPIAHDGELLIVTDGWYYIAVDTRRMTVLWKRLIDQNDVSRQPAMRFAVKGDYFTVLKENYDQKAIYGFNSRTGQLLWHTDPKNARSPQPLHHALIAGDKLYGIGVHPGQGFYFVGRNAKTGQLLFKPQTTAGYNSKPKVSMMPRLFGNFAVVKVQDRQDFELKVFDVAAKGKLVHTLKMKGVGSFGQHGRVSTTVQHGRLVMLSKDKLSQ